MDRIVVEKDDSLPGKERRRCVECGYSDEQLPGTSPEPGTRVSSSNIENKNVDDAKTPVRILDPGKSAKSD